MRRLPAILVFVLVAAALLAGCSAPVIRGGVTATSVPEAGSALFVASSDEYLGRTRIIGPEEDSTNGLVLGFETPWEFVRPGRYRVPAGAVVFHLHRGPLTKRGAYKFGFHARAGEIYDLRIEEIGRQPVTIVERGTGRVASTRGVPKRFAD